MRCLTDLYKRLKVNSRSDNYPEEEGCSLLTPLRIEKWLHQHGVTDFFIHKDLTVDVKGDLDLSSYPMERLPFYFGSVEGDVIFSPSQETPLTSLRGAPQWVGGDFIVSGARLYDFKGGPSYVGGHFVASDAQLISLIGSPKTIKGEVFLDRSSFRSLEGITQEESLTLNARASTGISLQGLPATMQRIDMTGSYCLNDLKGAPSQITGSAYFGNCNLGSLEGSPDYVGGDFYVGNNSALRSLRGGPRYVMGNYEASGCGIESMEDFMCEVDGNVYVENNPLMRYSLPTPC